MPAKLLLDENLSASVAASLCSDDGIDACHVRDRNLLGVEDQVVLERAYLEDRILVTANVDDFVKLARGRELHAGIILFEDASLYRDEQLALLRAALSFIAGSDMVKRVLWVNLDQSTDFEEIPPA